MIVDSLEKMEELVSKDSRLSWDGWDIIVSKPSPTAWMRKNAKFSDGRWYQADRIVPGTLGWELPASFAG
jgi:hypothetical protein